MNLGISKKKIQDFWGKEFIYLEQEDSKKFSKKLIKKKLNIAKSNLNRFLIFDWVQFIGITGSVASGNVKKNDDVDIFIVVKNNRMWLYRGVLVLKLGFNSIRRVWGKCYVDKLDTNFICEERALEFENKCVFIFHELIFMIPMYNSEFYKHILNVNSDLLNDFAVIRKNEDCFKKRYWVLSFFNLFAFYLQLTYMFLMRHKPDLKRILQNNRVGRIEFFPKEFRNKKVKEYQSKLMS